MRAGRAILIVLLFLWVGCGTEPSRTATVERQADAGKSRSSPPSALGEALCLAVEEGDMERVRSLIAEGDDVNSRNEGDATPLHRAVAAGRKEMVDLLIAHGANINATGGILGGTPLCEAITTDYSAVAYPFLKTERPDLGYNDKPCWELKEKFTRHLVLDIVRILIAHGADVNAKDEYGGRVLDYVLTDTPIEVVKLLLARGADPGSRGDDSTCVFHTAVAQDRMDLVTLRKWVVRARNGRMGCLQTRCNCPRCRPG